MLNRFVASVWRGSGHTLVVSRSLFVSRNLAIWWQFLPPLLLAKAFGFLCRWGQVSQPHLSPSRGLVARQAAVSTFVEGELGARTSIVLQGDSNLMWRDTTTTNIADCLPLIRIVFILEIICRILIPAADMEIGSEHLKKRAFGFAFFVVLFFLGWVWASFYCLPLPLWSGCMLVLLVLIPCLVFFSCSRSYFFSLSLFFSFFILLFLFLSFSSWSSFSFCLVLNKKKQPDQPTFIK